MLGGVVYALTGGPKAVYAAGVIGCAASAAIATAIVGRARAAKPRGTDLGSVLAGLHYIREHRTILGAISLDLFAVLLGGAVALLPVYARDILKTGPWGLGLLRSAPAIGATLMGAVVGALAAAQTRWHGDVVVRCGIRSGHDCLRPVA